MIDVALIGAGRWGTRLLAALEAHPELRVRAVVDRDRMARRRASRLAPGACLFTDLLAALPLAEALFVATPSAQHAEHAERALAAGLDVFVEKPLALAVEDAARLTELAARRRRVGMVGHVVRFDPRVAEFVGALKRGAVGELRELRARRLTQSGSTSPLWTLAPHDLATLFAIDPSPVDHVAVEREAARTTLQLELRSGLGAVIEVATTAARPRRETRARGTDGLLVLDELATPQPDALRHELDHFAACVATRQTPRTGFGEGLAVVEVIARASQALQTLRASDEAGERRLTCTA